MRTLRTGDGYEEALSAAVGVLRSGGLVVYPTDTLYGIAADPRNDTAVDRLFDAKGRDQRIPMPLIAADTEQAQLAGVFGEAELELTRRLWPGPLTIIVRARGGLAGRLLAGGTTVAIRVPAHDVARTLAARFGWCITSTSANRSGTAPTADPRQIDPAVAEAASLILDAGLSPGGPPSTIVEATAEGFRLVRNGAVPWSRVIKSAE